MDLDELRRNWEMFGQTDPLWAVLSVPSKQGNRWGADEFFATGRNEVDALMEYLTTLHVRPRRHHALDFGCGVGRITQALARHFARVDGVDISAPMVEHARRFNREGHRCRFHINTRDDLAGFDSSRYDVVYSNLVLQHIEPRYSTRYIAEFVRLLRPGGLAIFTVPSHQREEASPVAPLRAFRLRAHLTSPVTSLSGTTGERLHIPVRAENTGLEFWPAPPPNTSPDTVPRYAVRLGNHWLDASGGNYQEDDARAALPCNLASGEVIDLTLDVTLPGEPGEYLLELDMVQEAVAWFAWHGSPTVRLPVHVAGDPLARPVSDAVMEIHHVPRAMVERVIEGAGGRLVDVQDTHGGPGPGVVEYRYVVTKDRWAVLWFRRLWKRISGRLMMIAARKTDPAANAAGELGES